MFNEPRRYSATEQPEDFLQKTHHGPPIELFYSYSHEDEEFKSEMEKTLEMLKRDGHLNEWHDGKLLPGQHINEEIKKHMDNSDILVFLFSREFFASRSCVEEWEYAKELASHGKLIIRIPIIVRVCPWLDFLDSDGVLALPKDGEPIKTYADQDIAWNEVYEGIKGVVDDLRNTFQPKNGFLETLTKTEAVGKNREYIDLKDIFVFPNLTKFDDRGDTELSDVSIKNRHELLNRERIIIYGQDRSGKTALARFIYLSLVAESKPVLLLNLPEAGVRADDSYLRRNYEEQFEGDYNRWIELDDKTLIIDDFEPSPRIFGMLDKVRGSFAKIILLISSDVFISYFKDEQKLNDFEQIKIAPINQAQQELLIRKRMARSEYPEPMTDSVVDRIENNVNSIIISNRIVPRYPFYVLSILQAYESYMPDNMIFTSSGHCYQALIVAGLIRAGLAHSGGDIDAAFNFLEQLALSRFESTKDGNLEGFSFARFKEEYRLRFYIRESVVTRLSEGTHNFIDDYGCFRLNYVYYFFLGKILAANRNKYENIIAEMCDRSHISVNHLTLLFIIHHSQDTAIVDYILDRTSNSLTESRAATLDSGQTRWFQRIVSELPKDIVSSRPVQAERTREREYRTDGDISEIDLDGEELDDDVEQIFRILKNNKVIGQVLRNKYGQMERDKIEQIVETIVDSALRLVNVVLNDEKGISELAEIIAEANDEKDIDVIRRALERFAFVWTILNVDQAVNAINVPEVREAVIAVVDRKKTPAYDLVGYFNQLNSIKDLSRRERDHLRRLLRKHDDMFIARVLSLHTQRHLNTHASDPTIEQSIYDLLGVKRTPRLLRGL